MPILLILSTAGFPFVAARLLYALLRRRSGWLEKAVMVVVLVLPVTGLALNHKMGARI